MGTQLALASVKKMEVGECYVADTSPSIGHFPECRKEEEVTRARSFVLAERKKGGVEHPITLPQRRPKTESDGWNTQHAPMLAKPMTMETIS